MIGKTLRRLVPRRLKERLKHSRLYVKHRAEPANVYHCCVQRTASRWLQRVLSDSRVLRYSGLELYDYHANQVEEGFDPQPPTKVRVEEALPPNTIVAPLYLDYRGFKSIPKPDDYRAFFVMRDRRDITVSWYFAMKESHDTGAGILDEVRAELQAQSRRQGLRNAIERLATKAGQFPALRSWAEAELDDRIILVRYEDLIGPAAREEFRRLFDHCDIRLPDGELDGILEDYAFRRMTGRKRGEEDTSAHLRKGVAGDWMNHLDDELLAHFRSRTGDLVELLGYEVSE